MPNARGLIIFAALILLVGCAPAASVDSTEQPLGGANVQIVTPAPSRTPTPPVFAPEPDDHARGPDAAYLTIVLYGDFQSTATAQVVEALDELRARYDGNVRVVWRHYPLVEVHDKAALAAQAAEAAGAQGAFWSMHDKLLAEQETWRDLTPEAFRAALEDYAAALDLEVDAFAAALDAHEETIETALEHLAAQGLSEADPPLLSFNGERYHGVLAGWAFDAAAQAILLEQRQYSHAPSFIIDMAHNYRAVLVTTKGDIVIDLLVEQAPVAVNNFVYLARDGWYDGAPFFEVVAGVMAVTGDPTGTGLGDPGYSIYNEAADNGLVFDTGGLVAMRRSDKGDIGSQFFITMGPLKESYDGVHVIFGRVTAGMETLQALALRDPIRDILTPPADRLEYIIIEETLPLPPNPSPEGRGE